MSSMMYTIGTALGRAQASDLPVEVLVGGQWISGKPKDVDSLGVVIETDDRDIMVMRIESISAVKMIQPRLSLVEVEIEVDDAIVVG